jgi:hypothetical protein
MTTITLVCNKTHTTKDKKTLAIKGKKYKVHIGLTKRFYLTEANTFEPISNIHHMQSVFKIPIEYC